MDELEEVQKKYLKNLLNSGKIVPEAIIGSSLEDLIEIVNEDSLRPGMSPRFIQIYFYLTCYKSRT